MGKLRPGGGPSGGRGRPQARGPRPRPLPRSLSSLASVGLPGATWRLRAGVLQSFQAVSALGGRRSWGPKLSSMTPSDNNRMAVAPGPPLQGHTHLDLVLWSPPREGHQGGLKPMTLGSSDAPPPFQNFSFPFFLPHPQQQPVLFLFSNSPL